MRKLLLAALVITFTGCNDKPEERVLSKSSGALNTITVVMPNNLWAGSIGEELREVLAGPVDGLPQIEPLFDLNQMPEEAFSGFMRKQRTFLKVEVGSEPSMEIIEDMYARPQTGIIIRGRDNESVINEIWKNSKTIIETFKAAEIQEKIRRIELSLKEDESLKKQLGISLKFPSAYRYTKSDEFFWMRKDIPSGDMNITAYEVPYSMINRDTNTIASLIKMRDSISGNNVTTDEGTRFITEEAFAPYLNETTIAGRKAYEMKGMWEVKGRFMAGPFVNYAIEDKENDRYIILEGFVFKPSASKRDNMFELESILKSVKFLN